MFKIVFEGTKELIEEKINNPFWKTFIFGWITWNWKVWYITFFISEEKIIGNKIEYINNMYNCFDFYGLFPFLGYFLNWIIAPILIAYLIIFIITEKITFKFLKKHKENKIKENEIVIKEIKSETQKESAEILKLKKDIEKEKLILQKQIELQKQEIKKLEIESDKNKFEDDKINKEYSILTNKYPHLINEFKKLIVDKKGESHYWDNSRIRNISSTSEEVLLFNDLIEEIDRTDSGAVIIYKPTTKGKYFLKKDTLEN